MGVDGIRARLGQLLAMGEQVLGTRYESNGYAWVLNETFLEWRAGSLSFIRTVFGKDSVHFTELMERCTVHRHNEALEGQAILKAAKADLDGGFLKRVEDLVSADVFSDFLEMAAYLHEQGYKDPAASLIGAVLEDGLRRIARGRDIILNKREDIGSLNEKLAKDGAYNRLVQTQVDLWRQIRNNADHAHFDEYSDNQVTGMLNDVRSFLGLHL